MEIPDDMPDEIKALLHKIAETGGLIETGHGFLGAVPVGGQDYSTWKQVGTLTPEEKVQQAKLLRRGRDIAHEDGILFRKHQQLMAEVSELKEVFWHKIEKEHSLPMANFHLEGDKILIQPGSVQRRPQ